MMFEKLKPTFFGKNVKIVAILKQNLKNLPIIKIQKCPRNTFQDQKFSNFIFTTI